MVRLSNFIWVIVSIFLLGPATAHSMTDSNPSNNQLEVNVTVVETNDLKLIFRPVDNQVDSVFTSHVEEFIKFTNRTYPISDKALSYSINSKPLISEGANLDVDDLQNLLFNLDKSTAVLPTGVRTVGIVPQGWFATTTTVEGTGFFSGNAVYITPSVLGESRNKRQIVAHEVAHTYGLCDEHDSQLWDDQDIPLLNPCPNADKDDNNVLDSNCTTQGCETETIGKLNPWVDDGGFVNFTNFMGDSHENESNAWISVESYNHLLDKFEPGITSIVVPTAIVVNGVFDWVGETASYFTSYIIENVAITQQSDVVEGNFSIEVIDSSGAVTSKINTSLIRTTGSFNGSSGQTNKSYFIVIMNFSSNHKGFRIRYDVAVKNETNRSTNAPTINLTTNLTGIIVNNNFTLSYNSTDVDGDTVEYAILISSDGGSNYTTLDVDYPNASFNINTSGFTESQQYKVKILATDGINTNTTVSEGVFEIDNDLRITNLSILDENQTKRTFFYVANNTLGNTLNNIKEELDTGETTVELTTNHSLAPEEDIMVFIEYNYSSGGDKTVTAISGSLKINGGF